MTTSKTPNYQWTVPEDDELIRNGAAAIKTLGTAVDASLKNHTHTGFAAATHTHQYTDVHGMVVAGNQPMVGEWRVIGGTANLNTSAAGFSEFTVPYLTNVVALTISNANAAQAPCTILMSGFTPPSGKVILVINRVDTAAAYSGAFRISYVAIGK